MKMRNYFVGLTLLLSLVGCATPAQPTEIATIRSVESAINMTVPTQPGLVEYETERVATVLAIQTASATPRATHTPTQTSTMDLNPTSVALATRNSAYHQYCGGVYGYFYTDTWGICDRDSHQFTLFNLDGRVWHYSYDQLGVTTAGEGPEYMTRAIYWTTDNQYAYLTAFPVGYDPLGPFLGNATALFRVDLEDGEIQTILAPYYFYSLAISPTGKYLAYVIFDEPLELVIQDLQSNQTWQTELEPKYTQAGGFVWSSDERRVAYKLILDGDECTRDYAIRLLNVDDKNATTIVGDTHVNTCQPVDLTYYVVEVTDNSVLLEQNGDIWVYRFSTQQLSLQATATPTP